MTWDLLVFGLVVRVPFPCPSVPEAPAGAEPDLLVQEGEVVRALARPVASDPQWDAEPGRFLWRGGRRSGRFLVEAGRTITLQRNGGAEEPLLGAHFLGTVLVAALRQRGLMVLHATAVVGPDGGAVAVSGPSGAGKSTTLAALADLGCRILSDDITVLRPGPDGGLLVLPGLPHMHLLEDSAAALGRDLSGLERYPARRAKAVVPIAGLMGRSPAPLRALYLLDTGPGPALALRDLEGAERFAAIQECLYGPLLPQEHGPVFPLLAALAGTARVGRLTRPRGRWTAAEVAARVLHG